MTIFGPEYADVYDATYATKDYAAEVRPLARLVDESRGAGAKRMLDVGCGTGRHALELTHLGFKVTGTDPSEAMLARARERCGENVSFESRAELLASGQQFDLTYSLFDVMSYQCTKEALVSFLQDLAAWTAPGGLVVADAWHLPGLILDPPQERTRQLATSDGRLVDRRAQAVVDWSTGVTEITYTLSFAEDPNGRSTVERHSMRAFTQLEISLALDLSGLELVSFCSGSDLLSPVEAEDWHFAFVARKPRA